MLFANSLTSDTLANLETVAAFYGLDFDDLKAEVRVFINQIKEKEKSGDQLDTMASKKQLLLDGKQFTHVLPLITKLVRIFLTIPITSASAERSFFCLRCLKNYLRSTMCQNRLSSLSFLNIERDISFNMEQIITEFANKAPHKPNLLSF